MNSPTQESLPFSERLGTDGRWSVVAIFVVSLIVLIGVIATSYYLQLKTQDALNWKTHTNHVRIELSTAQTQLNELLRGMRGFAIAGKEDWLNGYRKALDDIPKTQRTLETLTADNPVQQQRLKVLREIIPAWIAFSERIIDTARTQGLDTARQIIATGDGRKEFWRIEQVLTDMADEEARLLTERDAKFDQLSSLASRFTIFGSLLSLGLIAWAGYTLQRTIGTLRAASAKNAEQDWLKTNLAKFTQMLQGQRDPLAMSKLILSELAPLVGARHGVFYALDPEEQTQPLKLLSAYAHRERKSIANRFDLGEGLVGQCALEKERILLTKVPEDYIQISSGLGEAAPFNIVVFPVLFEGRVKAVIELASFDRFTGIHQAFLDQFAETVGIMLNSIESNLRTEELLKQSQSLTSELQVQQEELRQTNEELEEKTHLLVEQKSEVERKNSEVELARRALEDKAAQLAITSKYKSEFLANMSHELRTPLNSLLLLSHQLIDNPEGNLTAKQQQFARTIEESGHDLLNLINDILDLSKIESGTVTLELMDMTLSEVHSYVERNFRHMVESKKLALEVVIAPDLPPTMRTDIKRLQQVLKNLLSNALKFTARGTIKLNVARVTGGWSSDRASLNRAEQVIAFAVSDTGIGIAPEKQNLIFEAFQQADGSTARKYGGTGLGLSISREIARLLGGEITLRSVVGEGSTFTFYVPLSRDAEPRSRPELPAAKPAAGHAPTAKLPAVELPDDRNALVANDRILLIVEDDKKFSDILFDLAHQNGFKVLRATEGETALRLAREYRPDAITLDLRLPDVDGWHVLEQLKQDAQTRHIPVHIISVEEERLRGLQHGALDFLTKPMTSAALTDALGKIRRFIERPLKQLLVVEDNEHERKAIVEFIGNGDVKTTAVANAQQALAAMEQCAFDCVVLDLMLPGELGFELLETIRRQPERRHIPVIVYTAKDLSPQEQDRVNALAEGVVLKETHSLERLLDQTALFLHRITSNLPEDKRRMLEKLYRSDTALKDKKVLVVDDDMRNIFALTSLLERFHVTVLSAENGKDALRMMQETSGLDAVLMDIMMPEMDGYEVTRAIRQIPQFQSLPIIALTAKAMKGDREKCIQAGASDYITKPVDAEKLLSMLRVWLYR